MLKQQITGKEAVKMLIEGYPIYYNESSFDDSILYIDEDNIIKFKTGEIIQDSKFRLEHILNYKWFIPKKEQPEYNLTIQDVMQKENVGKYYKMEDEDMLLWLSEDNDGYLELLVIEDDYTLDEYLYYEIQSNIYLEFIVNSKYKEVEFNC